MAIRLFWTCEAATLDGTHDFTVGPTPSANSTVAIDATAARVGSNGILVPTSSDRYQFDTSSTAFLPDPSNFAVGFWLQWPTAIPGSGLGIPLIMRGANANDQIQVRTISSEEMRLIIQNSTNGAINLDTTAANLVAGNWYFIHARGNSAINYRALTILDTSLAEVTSVVDSSTDFSANVPADLQFSTGVRFGDNAAASNEMWLDNFFIADAYDEPLVENALITSYTAYDSGGASTILPLLNAYYA